MSSTPRFDNSFARLPEQFFQPLAPLAVSQPALIHVNNDLAELLGFKPDFLKSEAGIAALAGNSILPGSEPLASAYAGHQFGVFNPQLGDGRAHLLGEIIDRDDKRRDLQLKGSGPTAFSRGGDGRSPLGPVLREYLVSEAMFSLGVPTTRSLAAVSTGEPVYREQRLPGAILARVASSHIRIGTFQYHASRGDRDALQRLCDHALERHYPAVMEQECPPLGLLTSCIEAQAKLIAQWQSLGFIHGVMNTDNMLICGETVDYGPCAFMDGFKAATVFSSIDHQGRYAYQNQAAIGHWNLAQLAQCLLPLIDPEQEAAVQAAQAEIDRYPGLFAEHYLATMRGKFGLHSAQQGDAELVSNFLQLLELEQCDFTLAFRHLADRADSSTSQSIEDLFSFPAAFEVWLQKWQERTALEAATAPERQKQMYARNPAFIPRNHLVEKSIQQATNTEDFSLFYELQQRLQQPFEYDTKDAHLARSPSEQEQVRQTFCGT